MRSLYDPWQESDTVFPFGPETDMEHWVFALYSERFQAFIAQDGFGLPIDFPAGQQHLTRLPKLVKLFESLTESHEIAGKYDMTVRVYDRRFLEQQMDKFLEENDA